MDTTATQVVMNMNEILELVKSLVQLVILPFGIYVVNSLHTLKNTTTRINTLIGDNDNPGLISRVKRLEDLEDARSHFHSKHS